MMTSQGLFLPVSTPRFNVDGDNVILAIAVLSDYGKFSFRQVFQLILDGSKRQTGTSPS
jgi:hypothetical protein